MCSRVGLPVRLRESTESRSHVPEVSARGELGTTALRSNSASNSPTRSSPVSELWLSGTGHGHPRWQSATMRRAADPASSISVTVGECRSQEARPVAQESPSHRSSAPAVAVSVGERTSTCRLPLVRRTSVSFSRPPNGFVLQLRRPARGAHQVARHAAPRRPRSLPQRRGAANTALPRSAGGPSSAASTS